MADYSTAEELANDLHTVISNDEWTYRRYLEIVENTENPGSEYEYAQAVGEAVRDDLIGYRLSDTDLGVPANGLHDLLWMQYMGSIDWTTVGKLCLADYGDENA